jgi:prophage regulatory protein
MNQAPPELDRIIRLPELLRITGLSTASVYRKIAENGFPRPVRLGKNAVGWRAQSVVSWLESLEEVDPTAERGPSRSGSARDPEAGPGEEIPGRPRRRRPAVRRGDNRDC